MSEKRIIKVNPELFKITGRNNTTRKKRNSNPTAPREIKVKAPSKERNPKTLKRSLLKFIRNQQDNKLNSILENSPHSSSPSVDNGFQTDFNSSLEYLAKLTKENESKIKNNHNSTIRKPIVESMSQPIPNINLALPSEFMDVTNKVELTSTVPVAMKWNHYPPPQYGCMKGGKLPTYRNWKNTTQKNYQPSSATTPNNQNTNSFVSIPLSNNSSLNLNPKPSIQSQNTQYKMNHFKEMSSKMEKIRNKPRHKPNKQKKTLRRTFHIGKSKVYPKVSVLVSNKTIRKNITTKSQLLKQVPIHEVKKFLIKKGFIKIGSIAPNDVLRKMYETAVLMCGEIQNHNPDNLLYNYLHDESVLPS